MEHFWTTQKSFIHNRGGRCWTGSVFGHRSIRIWSVIGLKVLPCRICCHSALSHLSPTLGTTCWRKLTYILTQTQVYLFIDSWESKVHNGVVLWTDINKQSWVYIQVCWLNSCPGKYFKRQKKISSQKLGTQEMSHLRWCVIWLFKAIYLLYSIDKAEFYVFTTCFNTLILSCVRDL